MGESNLYQIKVALAKRFGFEYDPNDPFGGLPVLPESERREPEARSNSCYICRDSSYAARGLPLCRACPVCGGHVAADDTVCDDCGLSDQWFWETVELIQTGNRVLMDIDYGHIAGLYEKTAPSYQQASKTLSAIGKAISIPDK